MNEDRLIEIETKLAFQEDTLQQLNTVISTQQKQIDQLELLCKNIVGRLKEFAETQNNDGESFERPPHY